MSKSNHNLNDKAEKLVAAKTYEDGQKLIFNWVKAGDINVREFTKLCELNQILPKS
mgnify:FL=1